MPCAVVLTALPVEYLAVRKFLMGLREVVHSQGTVYEQGIFVGDGFEWSVGIAEVGAGNAGAAIEAERAISFFKPDVLLFVGIAGGLKDDVQIGDVVAATKVYGYEAGKVTDAGFLTRPDAGKSASALVQRARAEAKKDDWLGRGEIKGQPKVVVGAIAAGDKVLADTDSEVFKLLRSAYNDAIAVEMEGYGFLSAAFAYPSIKSIVVRGISDMVAGKNDDAGQGKEVDRHVWASNHASAFAFEMLAKFKPEDKEDKSVITGNIKEESNISLQLSNSKKTANRMSNLIKMAVTILMRSIPDDNLLERSMLNQWTSTSASSQDLSLSYSYIDPKELINMFQLQEIFVDETKAREFLFGQYIRSVPAAREKQRLVNKDSRLGYKLYELMDAEIISIQFSEKHARTVVKLQKLISRGEISISVVRRMLESIYEKLSLMYSQSEINIITGADFDNDMWENLIFLPQDDVETSKKSHLHHANEYMGEQLGGLLKKKITTPVVSIKVVEGGVGGLNTTHKVLSCILKKIEEEEPKVLVKNIYYQGVEINESIANNAELLINFPLNRQDKRAQFFSRNRARFLKIDNDKHVIHGDMLTQIDALLTDHRGTVDLFMCSYAFHHISNGKALRNKLFNKSHPKQISWSRNPDFFRDLINLLEKMKKKESLQYVTLEVKILSGILPDNLIERHINEIIADVKYVQETEGYWLEEPPWSRFLLDNQEILLTRVKELLKPDGLIAIADPDGYSKFNLKNICHNPEMGCANFLPLNELKELVEKLGFDIIQDLIQIREKNTFSANDQDFAKKLNESSEYLHSEIDPNMGYILIAKNSCIQSGDPCND